MEQAAAKVRTEDSDLQHEAIEALDLRLAELRLADPRAMARVREEMGPKGPRHPVLVSDGVEQGKLVVVDGFKRLRVARELGHAQMVVRVVHLAAAAAHAEILKANGPRCGVSDFEEGLVVERLHRRHGMSQAEIGELLGRHKSWVCRRLALVERLDSGVQESLRLGLVSASLVRELVRLPRGNQGPAAQAIRAHHLSSRQAAQLVRVLLVVDPNQRKDVLARPLDHLPQRRDAERYPDDPRLSAAANRVRQHLLRFRAASNRVTESLRTHGVLPFASEQWEVLAEIGKGATKSAEEAMSRVERLLSSRTRREDAGSRTSAMADV